MHGIFFYWLKGNVQYIRWLLHFRHDQVLNTKLHRERERERERFVFADSS